jgi:predicted O-methyltransferase YrrM
MERVSASVASRILQWLRAGRLDSTSSASPAPAPPDVKATAVPHPADFRSGPSNASAYAGLGEKVRGIRVQRPGGVIPGTLDYPHDLFQGPAVPGRKNTRAYREWEFFRAEGLPPVEKPWPFPEAFDNLRCPWLQVLKRLYAMPITFPASISPEGGMLLHSIVRNTRPKVVVETGTFLGVSALWIAAALAENGQGGVLHCFDDFVPVRPGPWRPHEMKQGVLEFVADQLRNAGLAESVVLHPGNTSHELRAFAGQLRAAGGVQLAYLDADHRPMGVCQDFWAVEPLLPTGGLVVLHDTFPGVCGDDGPRFLLDNVNAIAAGQYQVTDLFLSPINYGLGVMRRVG